MNLESAVSNQEVSETVSPDCCVCTSTTPRLTSCLISWSWKLRGGRLGNKINVLIHQYRHGKVFVKVAIEDLEREKTKMKNREKNCVMGFGF